MQPDPLPAAGETIGQRLKRLRLERGLSQRELAAPGVSYAYISRIEAGTRQPSVKALRRLAAKLGVSADYLETGSGIGQAGDRELRLADLELAVRLQGDEAAEEPLAALAEEAAAAGDHEIALRARFALASLAQGRGDHRRAVELLEAAVEEHEPSPLAWVEVYDELGRAYAASGRPDRAVELFERCLQAARNAEQPNPPAEARYATLLSYALSDAGDLGRAEQVLNEALEHVGDTDDSYMRVRLYWSLARLAYAENRPTSALANTRKAIALLEATEDALSLARAHLLAASITISRRDVDSAAANLDAAERLLGRAPSFADTALLGVRRAQLAALEGDGERTVAVARRTIDMLGEEHPDQLGAAYAALGEGLGLQGEIPAADEAYRRAVDLLEAQRQWREASGACRAWAHLLESSGRERQAIDVLERAAELALRAQPVAAGH